MMPPPRLALILSHLSGVTTRKTNGGPICLPRAKIDRPSGLEKYTRQAELAIRKTFRLLRVPLGFPHGRRKVLKEKPGTS